MSPACSSVLNKVPEPVTVALPLIKVTVPVRSCIQVLAVFQLAAPVTRVLTVAAEELVAQTAAQSSATLQAMTLDSLNVDRRASILEFTEFHFVRESFCSTLSGTSASPCFAVPKRLNRFDNFDEMVK